MASTQIPSFPLSPPRLFIEILHDTKFHNCSHLAARSPLATSQIPSQSSARTDYPSTDMSTNESNGVSAVTTGQAPQAQSPQSTQAAVNALSQSNSGGDSLICQWQSCGERTTTPEALYVSCSCSYCSASRSWLAKIILPFGTHTQLYSLLYRRTASCCKLRKLRNESLIVVFDQNFPPPNFHHMKIFHGPRCSDSNI